MILRRITDAFRKQDWFTVAVETLIVVLGVFLGIQLDNWNDAQKARVSERQLLESLHKDVLLAGTMMERDQERRPQRQIYLAAAYAKVFGLDDAPLSQSECSSIESSFISSARLPLLPTIRVLESGPGLDVISDAKLRTSIAALSQSVDQVENFIEKELRIVVEPGQAFPDLVALSNWIGEDGEVRLATRCNLEKMRTDQKFLNAIALNRDYQDSLNRRITPVLSAFSELHAELDRVLSVQHGEDGQ
jgi:hypothetical protein